MVNDPPIKGFFGRMFPAANRPLSLDADKDLENIGSKMRENLEGDDLIGFTAGYTYFGQFIDHDLTWDRSNLPTDHIDPCELPNYRDGLLNLDHLYGAGPDSPNDKLYDGDKGAARFRIFPTAPSEKDPINYPGGKALRDVPYEQGALQMGDGFDFRNLENLIVRQLHVVFLKFHNAIIEHLENGSAEGDLPDAPNVFEKARKLVAWHYQFVVWHDFLGHLLHEDHRGDLSDRTLSNRLDPFFIPVEFSLAAFRFGHSMVRESYPLNCHRDPVPLLDLLSLDRGSRPLPEDFVLEWGRVFRNLASSGRAVVPPRAINTRIAETLHKLPAHRQKLFTPAFGTMTTATIDLPVMTLKRGARAMLPSGQEVAQYLVGQKRINEQELLPQSVFETDESEQGRALRSANLTENTPLWYYVLKEAESQNTPENRGNCLGPVGSEIILQVIHGSLWSDPNSFVREKGPKWQPPSWNLPKKRFSGTQGAPITSLKQIIIFSGDAYIPQGCRATPLSRLFQHWPRIGDFFHRIKETLAI